MIDFEHKNKKYQLDKTKLSLVISKLKNLKIKENASDTELKNFIIEYKLDNEVFLKNINLL